MERHGELIFVPFGGGHVRAWSDRFAPLARPEFHLYDHELPPETELRQAGCGLRQSAFAMPGRSHQETVS